MSTSNLKISIAALSLCVSTVAIYIHLPYVIAAVSGSGAIEAVPLAIFTVSTVIVLVSVAYLIKLAVSPQTEMEGKSNASVPPPPPLPFQYSSTQPDGADLLAGVGSVTLKKADGSGKKPSSNNVSKPVLDLLRDELDKKFKSRGDAWQKNKEEEIAKIEEQREKIRKKEANTQGDGLFNKMMESTLLERRERIDASSPPDSNGWSSNGDEEQNKQSFAPAQADAPIEATYETDFDEELRNCKNEPVNFQSDNEKRSEGSDSAYGSKSSSPLCFGSETEKPQVPASLQEEPSVTKVNNVDPVNSRA